ncbi:pentatricopeptide repeat-containing protein At2g03380, mitochondrial-like [Nicotiana tabacum]|uniref:Pentatricopeptide repeat-containing protein At2g03380, mitochondrial-like n=1 Tax=Nicotiana tabacum TaxID=4097 RepID=A0A1S3ZEF0_TOBAC|nr:PREDICTED: pentatricopeptide repeat-containing protein At2g03380, mitochondrial-like [Nicotiana tabacum]
MKIFIQLQKQLSHFTQYRAFTSTRISQNFLPNTIGTESSLASISSNPCFALLSLCRTLSSLKKIHALFIVHGETHDVLLKTKLISLYGLFGHLKNARKLFDEIPNPDLFSCKAMIRWYFMNDKYDEIIGFYNFMRKGLTLFDNVVFSIVLKACSELCDIDEGRNLHCHIVKGGNSDSFVLTGLVDMYAKCGKVESSRDVFDDILDRNVVCWTSMIVGYVKNDCAEEGLVLFSRMRDGLVEGNEYTLGSIVTACAKLRALHQGKWVHGHIIKSGIELNSYLVTALVDMYMKCGATAEARVIFDELCANDFVTWTAMIVGYSQSGYPDEALKLFTDEKWQGILPSSITLSSVLSACAQLNNLKLGKSVHTLRIKLGLYEATVTNALVDMYAKCGAMADARCLFENFAHNDVVAWNSLISAYSLNGSAKEGLILFHRMRSKHLQPDEFTMVSVLSICASLANLRVGSSFHAFIIKEGLLSSNLYVGTALVNVYARSGDAKSARVFDEMTDRNAVTWNSMIGGYAMQGDCRNSFALLSDMIRESFEPNDIIFTSILSACSHRGMIEEGWRFFYTMCEEYRFVPSMKHYTCMVDLLARAGRLKEALDFIDKMPIQPDIPVFGAFLHGCGIHTRFDLGEVAVRKMLELLPHDACYYVLMSNLYASDGRWSQAYQMRELMKSKGLNKSPGCSQVNMDCENDCLRVSSIA